MTVTPPPHPMTPGSAISSTSGSGLRGPTPGATADPGSGHVASTPVSTDAGSDAEPPPLPPLLREIAGSAHAHACDGAGLDQLYRDLDIGLFSPDRGSGSPPLPAPCASLLVPSGTDGLAQTLLARVDPPSDLSGAALVQLFTGLSALQMRLPEQYGAVRLAERIDQTAASLSLASHWLTCLARAVVSLDARLHESERRLAERRHESETRPDLRAELAAAEREVDDLRRQLSAREAAAAEQAYESTRLGLYKAELTRHLTLALESNRESVGSPDDVADFLASSALFPACDRGTLVRVLDACRRRDVAGLTGVHFSVLPLPGVSLPPAPPADTSPVVLPTLTDPPIPPAVAERRAGGVAGLTPVKSTTPGEPIPIEPAPGRPAGADEADDEDMTLRDLGGDGDTVMGEAGPGDAEPEAGSGSKRSLPAPPEESGAKRLHLIGSSLEIAGSGLVGPEFTPSSEEAEGEVEEATAGAVAAPVGEPATTLSGSPMVVCTPGVNHQAMPTFPDDVARGTVDVRYAWLRQTPEYRHDLPIMAGFPTGGPAVTVRPEPGMEATVWSNLPAHLRLTVRLAYQRLFRFSCIDSPLRFSEVTLMGRNSVLRFYPTFDKGPIAVPLLRAQVNGFPVQRDSKGFKLDSVTGIFPTVYDAGYVLCHNAGPRVDGKPTGVKLQQLCGPTPDPYLELLKEAPWDAMWKHRCTLLYTLDPTTLDGPCQIWLVRYIAYMYHHRQAMWEHHHWLHTEKSPEVTSPGWGRVLARRGMLASYFTNATRAIFLMRPATWPPEYDDLLASEPALWRRRPMHSAWAPDYAALTRGEHPSPLSEQVRQLDTEEPFRVCYAGFGGRFVEGLRPVAQVAFRYHHYAGVAWSLPAMVGRPTHGKTWKTKGSSLGSSGWRFYTDLYTDRDLAAWRSATGPVALFEKNVMSLAVDVRVAILSRWTPRSGFELEPVSFVEPAMDLGRLPPVLPAGPHGDGAAFADTPEALAAMDAETEHDDGPGWDEFDECKDEDGDGLGGELPPDEETKGDDGGEHWPDEETKGEGEDEDQPDEETKGGDGDEHLPSKETKGADAGGERPPSAGTKGPSRLARRSVPLSEPK